MFDVAQKRRRRRIPASRSGSISGMAEKVCIPIAQSHAPTTAVAGGASPATAAKPMTPGKMYRPFDTESRNGVVLNRNGGALYSTERRIRRARPRPERRQPENEQYASAPLATTMAVIALSPR